MNTRYPGYWIGEFGRNELPVLGHTVEALRRIAGDIDRVSTQQLADIVMHDPIMTFKVLRYIQLRRHRSQLVDVTTIAHALMMLGMNPFLEHFTGQETLESTLAASPQALQGAMTVMSRARHAALYARDWAIVRHDIEVDEVTTAALLHDFAELLLWCCAPDLATSIQDLARAEGLRSEAAQREILGFPMISLQLELAREWQLPNLLCGLMDERNASTPRALNVSLAVSVARHSANGWDDAALPDDFASIGRLLGLSPTGARDRVIKIALVAAADWDWYGVPPPASLLPQEAETPLSPQT